MMMQAKFLCVAIAVVLFCGYSHGGATMTLQVTLRDMSSPYMNHSAYPANYWKYNGWINNPTAGSCGTANSGLGNADSSDFELPLFMYGTIRTPNAPGGVLYNGEKGLVGNVCNTTNRYTNCGQLGSDRKPVYAYSGRSPFGNVQSPSSFNTWFHDSAVAKTSIYNLTLVNTVGRTYSYSSHAFFPLDGKGWNDYNVDDNSTRHNFGFCMEYHGSFSYQGGETLSFTVNDDLWVYVDNKLVIDHGGLQTSSTVNWYADDMGLTKANIYRLDFFKCQRHSTQSVFTMTTSASPQCTYYDRCGVCEGDGQSCVTCAYFDRCGVCEGDGTACP